MQEKTLSTRRAFTGKLLKVDVMEVELPSGRKAVREVLRHPGAVAILAQMPDGTFLFVRQFRAAQACDFLEIVAGTLEPNEAVEVCAARELREECGYGPKTLVKLGVMSPAPGYTEERIHLFFAELEPTANPAEPDADEIIDVVPMTAKQIDEQIGNGTIQDAKTIVTWHLFCQKLRQQHPL